MLISLMIILILWCMISSKIPACWVFSIFFMQVDFNLSIWLILKCIRFLLNVTWNNENIWLIEAMLFGSIIHRIISEPCTLMSMCFYLFIYFYNRNYSINAWITILIKLRCINLYLLSILQSNYSHLVLHWILIPYFNALALSYSSLENVIRDIEFHAYYFNSFKIFQHYHMYLMNC